MTPTEEQKKVAEKIVSDFHARKNTGLTQLEQDIAQALQAAAENAAKAVLASTKLAPNLHGLTDEYIRGLGYGMELVQRSAASAAAPFLKGKGDGK